jgi:type I restriction enzyme S subunit
VSEILFTDVISAIIDNRGRTCPVADHGRPLIATNCITEDALYPTYETTRFVSDETYQTWFRGHPEPGDIIFVCKGKPGTVALAPNPVDFCIAQDMVAVRADETKIYPRFLFALLRSRMIRERVDALHVGTMIPHFKKGDFDQLKLPIVDRRLQVAIGDFYFDLSNKIESNRRIKGHLRRLSELLLRRSVGCPIGDSTDTDEDIRLVRVDSTELGIVKPGLGGANSDDQFEYLATAVVLDNSYESGEFGKLDALPSRANMRPGDDRIWFARMKSTAKSLWTPRESNQKWSRIVLSTGFLGLEVTNPQLAPLLMTAVRCQEFEEMKNQLCNGTTMQSINNDAAKSFSFRVPSRESEMTEISNQIRHNLLLEEQINEECFVLTSVRDSLLPELLSGRIRVRDGERVVEGVA